MGAKPADMKYDTIETINGALVQHGPANQRVYLMKLGDEDVEETIAAVDTLATKHSYTKIFAKIRLETEPLFLGHGYRREAMVPAFYRGKDAAVFLGKYLDALRGEERKPEQTAEFLAVSQGKHNAGIKAPLDAKYRITVCEPADAEEMAEVYREVFATYPYPIHEPEYLRETMTDNITYFAVRDSAGKIVALSSAERDRAGSNVEMTDFATPPRFRGAGFAAHLLERMDKELQAEGVHCAYTIARSYSAGMNITFARLGYEYAGTLTSNTDICGEIESMNVWYKALNG